MAKTTADKREENLLKIKRKQLGLTQTAVATRAGMVLQPYQKIESGERQLNKATFITACKILEALEIDIIEYFHSELDKQEIE